MSATPNSSTRSNSTMSNQRAPTPAEPARSNFSNSSGAATAAGDSNQAVATTDANAPVPAHGANSFTQGQAKTRLEKNGFTNVGGLSKDENGVWHGTAQHNGHPVQVWLDYKGNVGQQG